MLGFESRGSSVGTGPAEDAGSEGGRGSEVADEDDDDDDDDTGLVAGGSAGVRRCATAFVPAELFLRNGRQYGC